MIGAVPPGAQVVHDWFDYWTLGAAIAGAIVLLLYTSVTIWQATITRAALGEARKNSAEALAETRRSNEATEESNRIARDRMEIDRRAWLALVKVAGNTHSFVEVVIKNSGAAPASQIIITARGWHHPDANRNRVPIPTIAFVGPSIASGESAAARIALDLPEGLAVDQRLVVDAEFTYFDGFRSRETGCRCAWVRDKLAGSGEWVRFEDTKV